MTPLLLLPGLMCDARLFRAQTDVIATARAVAFGACDTVAQIAAEVLATAPPCFALGGLSMGGIVAMEVYRQAPTRITGLALLDTNARPERPEVAARRDRQIDDVRTGGLRRVMRDEMKPNYLAETPRKPAILDLCMAMADDLGPKAFERQSHALQTRPDQRQTLAQIAVPTLVLCGAEDTLCPPALHREMAALIPDASLQIIEEGGHLLVLEAPARTNAALTEWLRRL